MKEKKKITIEEIDRITNNAYNLRGGQTAQQAFNNDIQEPTPHSYVAPAYNNIGDIGVNGRLYI